MDIQKLLETLEVQAQTTGDAEAKLHKRAAEIAKIVWQNLNNFETTARGYYSTSESSTLINDDHTELVNALGTESALRRFAEDVCDGLLDEIIADQKEKKTRAQKCIEKLAEISAN